MLIMNCWSSYGVFGVFMHSVVQHGVRRGKFLDTFIQEQNNLRCLHHHISIAGEMILKSVHFGFRGRTETCGD
jgi:hypothetical protein